jgi:hypothetical protein
MERAGAMTTGRGGATCFVGSGDGTGFDFGLERTIEPMRLAAAVRELVLRDGLAARALLTTFDLRDLLVLLVALRVAVFFLETLALALLTVFFRDTAFDFVRDAGLVLRLRLFGGVRDGFRALFRLEDVALLRDFDAFLADRTLFLAVCLVNRIPS